MFTACSEERTKPLYAVKLSDSGVGKIGSTTPFEMRLIEPKFPGFEIDKFTFFKEGEPQPVISVKYREATWMYLFPTKDKKWVERIVVVSSHVESDWSAMIGKQFDKIYTRQQLHLCRSATEGTGIIIKCIIPGSKQLSTVYYSPVEKHKRELPSFDVLKSLPLQEVIWER